MPDCQRQNSQPASANSRKIEAGKFFLLLVQVLNHMAPVPFQVAEARLIVGQGLVLCLAFRHATSVKEFIMHVFRSFPLLMLLS